MSELDKNPTPALCGECRKYFDIGTSIHKDTESPLCDACRMKCSPCLECGAEDEYQANEMCLCSGNKDDCHGCDLWG